MEKGTVSNADLQIILVWPELCLRGKDSLRLCWTHFLPLEIVYWEVWPFLPETNTSVQKLSVNPLGFPDLIISKTNEPNAFVGHLTSSLIITMLPAWVLKRKEWVTLLDFTLERYINTWNTKTKNQYRKKPFLWLTGSVGMVSFANFAAHLAKPLVQLEEISISKLIRV